MRKKFYHAFKKCETLFMSSGIYDREVARSFTTNSGFIIGIDPAAKCPTSEYTQIITGRTSMI